MREEVKDGPMGVEVVGSSGVRRRVKVWGAVGVEGVVLVLEREVREEEVVFARRGGTERVD